MCHKFVLACLLLATSMMACTTVSADLGYMVPTEPDRGDEKWVVEARAATGGMVKLGVAARSKLGEVHDQVALAPELSFETSPGPFTLGLRAGLQVLQLDSQGGEWTVGAGTPYLQPLLQFRVGDPVYLFIGGTLEYEVNSNTGPDLLYLGGHFGLGLDL